MKLNYVENRNGARVVRWGNLCVFFVVAVLTPAISAGLISRLLVGEARYAPHGAVTGLVIFVSALTYSLTMPIDRLPRGARGQLRQILTRPISSRRFDDRFAQVACYAGSLLVLVLGILKLCRLGLDETHLFLGVLLVLCLSVLGVIGGTLAGPPEKAE